MSYIPLEKYDQFRILCDFPREKVTSKLISVTKQFREAEELEDLLLTPLLDPNRTPHGPAEIVDIMTLQLTYPGKTGVAGIILKGRAYKTVRSADISHQVFRLRKISDLKFTILGYTGNLLDGARDEFIHTAQDLSVDYTFIDVVEFARLAVICGLRCPRDGRKLEKGRCKCGYRTSGDSLNLLQAEALKHLRIAHELRQQSGVVIMPTASGKTRIAAVDSKQIGVQRILYVAHTHEILEGAKREFGHIYGANSIHTKMKYDDPFPIPSVHLTTIQSASRVIEDIHPHSFDYVVIDEFHHAAAKTYRKLLNKLKPNFLLGLTATPFRTDHQDVLKLCHENVIVNFELRTGIETGILVPYHYYGCFDDIDYSKLQHRGEYTIKDLNRVLILPDRDKAIIKKWRELAESLPTLAFCCSQEHAKRMAHAFRNEGVSSREYLGTTTYKDRIKLIQDFQYGKTKVLCAVDVLNEGIDIPFIECLLFLRPTESKRVFFQQLGRGLRRNAGKERVVVLDFIGNFYNAYRIVEYLGLEPEETLSLQTPRQFRSTKDIINIPLGCNVEFDEKVIDLFATQILDPRRATRHNIAQILIYVYRKTSKALGRLATRRDVDRNQILHSELYRLVFGSWENFYSLISESRES